jgi:hypothetical protein
MMKISEIIINNVKKTFDTIKHPVLSKLVHDLFDDYKSLSNNFTIPPSKLFNKYELTDISMELSNLANEVSNSFSQKDQAYQVLLRLVSYIDYEELN